MITRRSAMMWEQTGGYRNRRRARQFLPFSDSTHTLVKMNKQHSIIGHKAKAGCSVGIRMLKDELATWKNYLLTQRCEDRNMHITRTALIHLVTRATNRVSEFPPPGFEPRTDSSSLTTQDLVSTSPGPPRTSFQQTSSHKRPKS